LYSFAVKTSSSLLSLLLSSSDVFTISAVQ
jgi:hypothetical protein